MKKISDLRTLIIGGGSIGERHVFNLKKLGLKKIAIFDSDKKKSDYIAKKYLISNFTNLDSALSFEPDLSLVCTWADSHIPLSKFCIDKHSHVFIEKPISNSSKGVKEFLKKADSKKLKVGVGYNMRFEKGLHLLKKQISEKKVGKTLSIHSQWGNNISNWIHPDSGKGHYIIKPGGGVILDDSHEYDFVQWLIDDKIKSVYCQTFGQNEIQSKPENLASIILKFKKGTVASFVIDFVRPRYERFCHVISDKGDIKWSYTRADKLKHYKTRANSTLSIKKLNSKKIVKKNFHFYLNDLYINELQNFLKSITHNKKPMVDGWQGLTTLNIGLAALHSAKTNKVVKF